MLVSSVPLAMKGSMQAHSYEIHNEDLNSSSVSASLRMASKKQNQETFCFPTAAPGFSVSQGLHLQQLESILPCPAPRLSAQLPHTTSPGTEHLPEHGATAQNFSSQAHGEAAYSGIKVVMNLSQNESTNEACGLLFPFFYI